MPFKERKWLIIYISILLHIFAFSAFRGLLPQKISSNNLPIVLRLNEPGKIMVPVKTSQDKSINYLKSPYVGERQQEARGKTTNRKEKVFISKEITHTKGEAQNKAPSNRDIPLSEDSILYESVDNGKNEILIKQVVPIIFHNNYININFTMSGELSLPVNKLKNSDYFFKIAREVSKALYGEFEIVTVRNQKYLKIINKGFFPYLQHFGFNGVSLLEKEVVVISFTLNKDGNIININIKQSFYNGVFADACRKAIIYASKRFGKVPEELLNKNNTLNINFVFYYTPPRPG